MTEEETQLPTDLRISAQIRIANAHGVSMVVAHKGDPANGSIALKINRMDGTAEVLMQTRLDGKLMWMPAAQGHPMPEREADALLAQETDFDPDLWVVEIDDKQGRHWFPEKIIRD